MKRVPTLTTAALLTLAGCATSTTLIPKPPDGYEAIRFNQTFECRDHAINVFRFPAGTLLVKDRVTDSTGEAVYCGVVVVNGDASEKCFGLEHHETLVFAPGPTYFKQVRRHLPEGSLSEIRLQ